MKRRLRLLVLNKAMDRYRFLRQPARSLVEDDDYSYEYAFIPQDICEDSEDTGDGEYKYDCDDCRAFFEGTQPYTTQEREQFLCRSRLRHNRQ